MKDKKHTHGFNTPKDYFEDFEDRLFSKLSEDLIPKKTGFNVPDGYFNKIEDVILDKESFSKEKSKVINLFSKKRFRMPLQ